MKTSYYFTGGAPGGSGTGATNLQGAWLRGTLLAGCDFRGADLSCADLAAARIDERTDFRAARLCGADLRVDQTWRPLAIARFSAETLYDDLTVFPPGFDPHLAGLTRLGER
jgi:hypothetical protein